MGKAKPAAMIETLADLTPDPRNARRHNPRNVGMLEKALGEVGAARSIVIDEHGVVLAGNATIEAAARAGIEKVQVVDADGETIIAVRRTGLTPKQKTRLALYDNRTAELADWDADVIADLLATERELLDGLFVDDELAELLEDFSEPETVDAEPQIDRAAELNKKWQVKTGDLWRIGEHRLLCGDSTKSEDVRRVMGGDTAQLCVTSPPYWCGKEYEGERTNAEIFAFTEAIAAGIVGVVNERIVINVAAQRRHLHTGGDIETRLNLDEWCNAFRSLGWLMRYVRCWPKSGGLNGVGPGADMIDQNWEFLATFHNPALPKVAQRRVSQPWAMQAVWNLPATKQEEHSAPFTVELPSRFIQLHTDEGETIYEPFCGSGTTMVACENLQRKCRGIEISAEYCAVILERMATAFPALAIERA